MNLTWKKIAMGVLLSFNLVAHADLFTGQYGESQVFDVARSGCTTVGGSCSVYNFISPFIAPYTNWTHVTWASGDYIKFVDTGTLISGKPNIQLIQYDSAGNQKQIVSSSGYALAIGDGIVYIGVPNTGGGTGYFISNSVGIDPALYKSNTNNSLPVYSPTITATSPTLSTLQSYGTSSTPLAAGQTYTAPNPTAVTNATNATNIGITDNTSSGSTYYPVLSVATSGNNAATTSSTKLSFVPSTGALSATSFVGAGAFTTLSASSTVSGTGFSNYLASPPAIGGTTPAAGTFTVGKFTYGYSPNLTLSDAATIAWDTSTGQVATFTFVSNNRTMGAPTNMVNGGFYALAVIQNSGSNTLTWNSVFKWAGGSAPTLSTAAGAKDYFTFRSDGTNMYEQGRALGDA